jgi:hypothetical protein
VQKRFDEDGRATILPQTLVDDDATHCDTCVNQCASMASDGRLRSPMPERSPNPARSLNLRATARNILADVAANGADHLRLVLAGFLLRSDSAAASSRRRGSLRRAPVALRREELAERLSPVALYPPAQSDVTPPFRQTAY